MSNKAIKTSAFKAAFAISALALTGCDTAPGKLKLGEERIDPIETRQAIEMIELIRKVSLNRAGQQQPLKRFNQVKSNGCFDAEFEVNADIPTHFAHGVFANSGKLKAKMRFANASKMDDTQGDFRGLAIKINTKQNGLQQDFLFNSEPALFAANPQVFHDFIKAQADDSMMSFALSHLGATTSLILGLDNPESMFGVQFYSTTPSRLGSDKTQAVKHSIKPCGKVPDYELNRDDANYLRQSMIEHLQIEPACFEFMVQEQTNPDTMPIEDASVEWSQNESPFVSIATITIHPQEFTDPQSMAQCEQMTFNPYNGLPAHQPLGGINRVRKVIYQQLGDYRTEFNRQLSRRKSLSI